MSERYFVAGGAVDLTPGSPLPLAGYSGPRRLGAVRSGRLEANVLALSDGDGRTVVFVGLDLLYAGVVEADLRAAMTGVPPSTIFVAASHTHFAPATEPELPGLGVVDEGYLEFVTSRVCGLVDRSLDRLSSRQQPCHLAVSVVAHQSAVNRRRAVGLQGSRVRSLPNWSGPRDDLIRVIVARSRDDLRPLGAVWNHACHPVGYPERNEVSADFPGVARERLRAKWLSDVPVVFLQGFAGDLRPPALAPRIPRSLRDLRRRASTVRRGFGTFSSAEWRQWADGISAALESCCDEQQRTISGPITASREAIPLSKVVMGVPEDLVFSEHLVRFGEDLAVVGISAEVVVELLPEIRQRVQSDVLVPVGYIDRTVAYLPSDAMRREGGYEAGEFTRAFGVSWRFNQEAEQTALHALDRLAAS